MNSLLNELSGAKYDRRGLLVFSGNPRPERDLDRAGCRLLGLAGTVKAHELRQLSDHETKLFRILFEEQKGT